VDVVTEVREVGRGELEAVDHRRIAAQVVDPHVAELTAGILTAVQRHAARRQAVVAHVEHRRTIDEGADAIADSLDVIARPVERGSGWWWAWNSYGSICSMMSDATQQTIAAINATLKNGSQSST
jgi:hypothetical protein